MAEKDLKILLDIEPICKVQCKATDCRYIDYNNLTCNFKKISIDIGGQCLMYQTPDPYNIHVIDK